MRTQMNKVCAAVIALSALFGCTTKNDVPNPVVDTTHLDALIQELQALQEQVYGVKVTLAYDSANVTTLEAEIANLQSYLEKSVTYTVTVLSFRFSPLKGATLTLTQGGKEITAVSDANGMATFTGLYAGNVLATVDLDGFTRLVYRDNIISSTGVDVQAYSISSTVLMLPLGGTAQADSAMNVRQLKLYANYTTVDDTLGGSAYFGNSTPSKALPVGPDPNNPTVSYSVVTSQAINVTVSAFSNAYNSSGLAVPLGFSQSVISAVYEGAVWSFTADGNGIYNVKLPASDVSKGVYQTYPDAAGSIEFLVNYGEFAHDYTKYVIAAPYVINNANPELPTVTQTYIYRPVGSYAGIVNMASSQALGLSGVYPIFFNPSLN